MLLASLSTSGVMENCYGDPKCLAMATVMTPLAEMEYMVRSLGEGDGIA